MTKNFKFTFEDGTVITGASLSDALLNSKQINSKKSKPKNNTKNTLNKKTQGIPELETKQTEDINIEHKKNTKEILSDIENKINELNSNGIKFTQTEYGDREMIRYEDRLETYINGKFTKAESILYEKNNEEKELEKNETGINTPEVEDGAEKTPEQKKVEEAREKYANEISKYKKESKIWDKMKHYLTPEKKHTYISEKFPNVAIFKEAYDKARIELGNKMYFDKKMELEKSGKSDSEIKEELEEYKNTEIKLAVHYGESIEKNNTRIEKLPSKHRELLNKAMAATSDTTKKGLIWSGEKLKQAQDTKAMKLYKQIGDFGSKWKWGHVNIKGYELTIGKLGRSAALGAIFGYAGAARYGIKLLRGTAVAMGGGIILSKMAETHKTRLENLENQKNVLEASLVGLSGTELIIKQEEIIALEKRITEENASYMKKNALIVAAMIGTNLASAKIENALVGNGAGTHVNGHHQKVEEKAPATASGSKAEDQTPATTTKIKAPEENSSDIKTPEEKSDIPKEALIDSKHNIGITYAFRSQLEANSDLAHKLGYDVAPNKIQFLAELGKKLGYISEHGDVRVHGDGMGAAYVLHVDANGNPYVEEYQNGILSDTVHNAGDKFEDASQQEKYEYYHENTPKQINVNPSTKGEFDGEAQSITNEATRVEGSADEFTGEAQNINDLKENYNNQESLDTNNTKTRGIQNKNFPTTNKDTLSTNGAAEEMARRTANENSIYTVNIESTEQFINAKINILDKDFSRWFTRGSASKEWAHIQYKSMDEITKSDYNFISRTESRGISKLLDEARKLEINYHGKTADQLVNEIAKKKLE